ncbi:LpxI family protein [Hirschia litorea]|uniref:LpxI family protein n=1 Tax=Hirschia litorea TaxID=1199156 RepID=A0ABW2IHA7_9PROT
MIPSKLGIIAGSGNLPLALATHAANEGRDVFIVGIEGFAETSLLDKFKHSVISIGEVGRQISSLKQAGVEEVCFAGIVKRPDFKSLKLDSKGVLLLPKVIRAASQGDDALLRVLVSTLEKVGFKVVGADEVLGSLLAPKGALGKFSPSSKDIEDIDKAADIAAQIGKLDIGQGAVVCDGLVLAVEAQEGTDLMLQRCAELPDNLLGTVKHPKGVLVKRPKPGQERRIDLPTIGLKTLEGIKNANLAGIAVEAHAALILDKEQLIAYADTNNIWIYGF